MLLGQRDREKGDTEGNEVEMRDEVICWMCALVKLGALVHHSYLGP